jgi:hypothetical protein
MMVLAAGLALAGSPSETVPAGTPAGPALGAEAVGHLREAMSRREAARADVGRCAAEAARPRVRPGWAAPRIEAARAGTAAACGRLRRDLDEVGARYGPFMRGETDELPEPAAPR